MDSNHRNLAMADLQSAPFSHSGTYPLFVAAERMRGYNQRCSLLQFCIQLSVSFCRKKLPPTGFEPVISPLPRECSTPEPQRRGLELKMPMIGIEPTTYGLQNRCSTVEPHRHVITNIIFVKKFMSRGKGEW